ncbi:hypothetical protein MIND_00174600 [Mycena indigotica]|uniref:Peptidase C14 caspase domain-containing protein n=1 Tax=Mycena indigotica TaxID=2126181 RepID=A0A8H6TF37_9AGAR|nr:uncharacterized protein MIND_00174600 [Mycena indigotica]KAF7316553.1 hypothetical protein MIND_00174600 [Mycena indigotica]
MPSSPISPLCERCSALSPIVTRRRSSCAWRTPKRKALLIGINSVATSNEAALHGPHRDVRDMKSLLMSKYSFREEDIQLLVDDGCLGHLQPDRTNIMQGIKKLVENTEPGDKLFFLYCGHTIQVPKSSITEEFDDGLDECIVPLDGEDCAIKDYELRAQLVDPLPIGSSLVAVFDSCHSASLLDLEHLRCNRVFVPWVSKGQRMTGELRNRMVRHLALPMTSPTSPCSLTRLPSRSSATRARSRRASIDIISSPISPRNRALSPLLLSPARYTAFSPNKSPSEASPRSPFTTNKGNVVVSPDAMQRRIPPPLKLWETNKENLFVLNPNERERIPLMSTSPTQLTLTIGPSGLDNVPFTPSTATVLSPTATLYDSPVQTVCQGWCRAGSELALPMKAASKQAFVISLAACKDSELSWETEDGRSMTQAMIQVLSEDAHPSLRELVTRISHILHGLARERHSQAYAWKRYRRKHPMLPPDSASFDTETFQHPQIASHQPLDMEMRWEL